MGCDIHAFIEFTKEPPVQTGERHWSPFGSQFRLDRHYGFFAKLADVRNYPELGIVPVAPARGLPHDTGWEVNDDYWLYVSESGGDGFAARENAEKWVAHGSSRWSDEKRTSVSNPDAHTPSWVTPDEWEKALTDEKVKNIPDAYRAFLAAMRTLEQLGNEVRAVFWFDN